MKSINNLMLLGLGLAGSALATRGVCCRPNCGVCLLEECYGWYICTSRIFNTCCADERLTNSAVIFDNDQDYLAAVAAGHDDG